MAGSLSSPNLIKDVYTKLVFYNSADGKMYRDNGSNDVEVLPDLIQGNTLLHQTDSTINSGYLLKTNNNTSTKFSIDYNGNIFTDSGYLCKGDGTKGKVVLSDNSVALYKDSTNLLDVNVNGTIRPQSVDTLPSSPIAGDMCNKDGELYLAV